MKTLTAIPLCLTLLLLSWAVITSPAQARSAPWEIEDLISAPAPAFSLPNLEGKAIASTSFQSQLRLINFWATWCGPCRAEMPALDRLQQKLKGKGVIVIGIAIDNDQAVVKQFISTAKPHFPILHDSTMTAHDAYKVYAYPTTFLVDSKGIIRQYWIGPQEWDSEEFGKSLQGYLQ